MIQTFEAFSSAYQTHLFPQQNGPQSIAQQLANHFAVPRKRHLDGLIQSGADALAFLQGKHPEQGEQFANYVGEELQTKAALIQGITDYVWKSSPDHNLYDTKPFVDTRMKVNAVVTEVQGDTPDSKLYLNQLFPAVCAKLGIPPFKVALHAASYRAKYGLLKYERLIKWVTQHQNNPSLPIYRAVSHAFTPDNIASNAKSYEGIGIYWSHDPDTALAYDAPDGHSNSVVLQAEVAWSDVAWNQTLYKSAYALSHEHETELLAAATPCITGVGLPTSASGIGMMQQLKMKHLVKHQHYWTPITPTYVTVA